MCQTLLKALDILSATAKLKNPSKSLRYSCLRSAVGQEDLKPYRNKKKSHMVLGDQKSYYLQVFQGFY